MKKVIEKTKINKHLEDNLEESLKENIEDEENFVEEENIDDEEFDNQNLSNQETNLPTVVESLDTVSPQNDLLKAYIREISKYPLLTPEEEIELARKLVQEGDLNAAKKLVTANLRLVVKIAMEYKNAYANVMDLIQEGNIGLMKAVSKYDPTKGAKLSYYANWWIRSYILKYILENFRLVRVSTTQAQKKLFFHLMKEKQKLEAQGLDPTPKLLADKLHVREKDVVEMESRLGDEGVVVSLNSPVKIGNSESKGAYLENLTDERSNPDETLAVEELKQILNENLSDFVKTLNPKEKAVFEERVASENPKTLQEVADKFGLTRERARQIEMKVIEKLRNYYKKLI